MRCCGDGEDFDDTGHEIPFLVPRLGIVAVVRRISCCVMEEGNVNMNEITNRTTKERTRNDNVGERDVECGEAWNKDGSAHRVWDVPHLKLSNSFNHYNGTVFFFLFSQQE